MWIIVSTIVAPVMIQKLIAGTAGPATVLTGAASLVADTGLPAAFGRLTGSGFAHHQTRVSRLTGEETQPLRSPPVVSAPFPATTATPWQPRIHDPVGDQQVRVLADQLKKP
jgi:hypothetical protein